MNSQKEFTGAPTPNKRRRIDPELDVEAKSEETVDNEMDTAEPQQLHQLIDIRARTAELTDEEWKAHQIAQLDHLIAKNERGVIDRAMFNHRIKSKESVSGILASLTAMVQSREQAGIKVCLRRLDGLFSDGWRHIASFLEKEKYQALSRCSRRMYSALMSKNSIAKLTLDGNYFAMDAARRSALLSHYPHVTCLCFEFGAFSSRLKQLELEWCNPSTLRPVVEILQSPEYGNVEVLRVASYDIQGMDIDLSGTKLNGVSIWNLKGALSLPSSIRRVSFQFIRFTACTTTDAAAKYIASAFAVPELEFFDIDLGLFEEPLAIVKLIEKALYEPRNSKSSSMCISLTLGQETEITFDTAFLFAMRFGSALNWKCVEDWRVKLVVWIDEAEEEESRSELDDKLKALRSNYLVHWEWGIYNKVTLVISNKDCKICGCIL